MSQILVCTSGERIDNGSPVCDSWGYIPLEFLSQNLSISNFEMLSDFTVKIMLIAIGIRIILTLFRDGSKK